MCIQQDICILKQWNKSASRHPCHVSCSPLAATFLDTYSLSLSLTSCSAVLGEEEREGRSTPVVTAGGAQHHCRSMYACMHA